MRAAIRERELDTHPSEFGPFRLEALPSGIVILWFDDPDRKAKLVAAANQVNLAVADEMTRQHLPGLALGVVIDGELVYSKGYGVADLDAKTPPDLDTAYQIGSLTKAFTSLGVLALRDDGVLTLDDPLVRWVPEAVALV